MTSEIFQKQDVLKFECELCLENYNLFDKKPHSLVPCGHALCLECFNNLHKSACPFCRIKIENKIPNWEIVKRLPKPTIPIIFYQIEIKINSLNSVCDELNSVVTTLNGEIKDKIELVINELNNSDYTNNDKLKMILKKIDDNNQENLELVSNLTKTIESYKNKLELDENKYNSENLKKYKIEIEKLTAKSMDKINVYGKELNEFRELFKNNPKLNNEFIGKLEKYFLENSKNDSLNQQLNSIFSANIIRPAASQFPNDSNSSSNPEQETLHFNTVQKFVIVMVVLIILIFLMVYPTAMIIIGALHLNECPINYLIPIWLIVGGSSGVIVEILTAYVFVYSLFRTFRHRTFAEKIIFIFLIIVPFFTVTVFNIAWFFTGNAWIYPLHKDVQSINRDNSTTYCNSTNNKDKMADDDMETLMAQMEREYAEEEERKKSDKKKKKGGKAKDENEDESVDQKPKKEEKKPKKKEAAPKPAPTKVEEKEVIEEPKKEDAKKAKKKETKETKPVTGPAPVPEEKKEPEPEAPSKAKKGEKAGAKKKPAAGVSALKEALAKAREQEEAMQREEEEKIRKEEEARQKRLEQERLEKERKEKKKQKEKERIARLKQEGKFETKEQKEARQRALLQLQAMGAKIPTTTETPAETEEKMKKSKFEKPKKKQTQAQEKEEEEQDQKENVPEQVEENQVEKEEKIKENWWDSEEEEPEQDQENVSTISKATTTATSGVHSATTESLKREEEEETEESEGESEEEEEESESEPEDADLPLMERVRRRLQKRHEEAEKIRSSENLRSPVICVLGHVDTGKTKILDNLRRTRVQEDEAGGITQQIGATNVPIETIQERTKMCRDIYKNLIKIPGFLIIDTPGHESFKSLRTRGSSLCDIAILVIDIMHGLEPQTIESLNILKDKKTPFLVALNKIDRLFDFKSNPSADVVQVLESQPHNTKMEFEKRTTDIIVQLAEQGLNAALYYKNPDPKTYISLVPTSAHTSDGIGNLMALITDFTQTILSKRVSYSKELQCTVMEVKAIPGLGTTIDVCLVNGKLKLCDTIVVPGQEGPIVTQIRGLLLPQPNRELRVKNSYRNNKEVLGAQGVKIAAKELEKAMAGLPLFVANKEDEVEFFKNELQTMLRQALSSIKLSDTGVFVQASTLGSLEALLEFLRTSKIPYAGISIGPVHKKDVTIASIMLEKDPQYAVILAFDVKVEREAQDLADNVGVKIFTADIIYHLFDKFIGYRDELKRQKREEFKDVAVFPFKARIIPQFIFNTRDPIVCGVKIEAGFIKIGSPICAICEDTTKEREGKELFVDLGRVTSIEFNHKQMDVGKTGQEVCIKIENTTGGAPKLLGRHFLETDQLVSKISRESIDAVKNYFREEMTKADWQLIIDLKRKFHII
ncbi:unnamed protein product [Brachionus calyciflorus]|uniref:Eukaryotic translation initiation factor 5B n=1 Tax=Brachionus calyciflorus TaxID=104777 RepID=A0A813MK51_9BILA|nr:unnamed protein product [Brachionus calyciflorus]